MSKATKVTTKGKQPTDKRVTVSVGWSGWLGEIVSILEHGVNKPGRPFMPARPVRPVLAARLAESKALARACAKGDASTAERVARRIVQAVLAPGIKPVNAPSTARRKRGDRRALRNTRGRDAIYKLFRVYVRSLKGGQFRER